MSKIDPNFPHDIFKFLHKPIRVPDEAEDNFVERYLQGPQQVWEDHMTALLALPEIFDPEKCPEELLYYLKDIVGLTKELDNITQGLAVDDLRKIILLAVPLWRQKGIELGFANIIRLFTGFNSRIFNWFDYRMVVGEKAIGEEQLGEDAWIISLPGWTEQSTEGAALMLLQFEEQNLNDGSEYRNEGQPHGYHAFMEGGPFSQSDYFLRMNDFYMRFPGKSHFDWSNGHTIEGQIRTSKEWSKHLFYQADTVLGREVSLLIDTANNEITYTISDGTIIQFNTIPAGVDLDDDAWHKVAWVVDWLVGLNGETSIWVDETRIVNEALNGGFVRANINNLADVFVGSDQIGAGGMWGGLDALRVTKDARYDVTQATIVHPATNFLEYRAEELDEFQMDIRVVDDGTLDRQLTQRLLNLMRPSSERLNTRYIDFYDDFEFGKGQFTTIQGSAFVEDVDGLKVLHLNESSLEHVQVGGASDWTNYLSQFRCSIRAGHEIELRFLVQDENNFYAYRLDSDTRMAYFEKSVAGVRSDLAPPVEVDVEPANLPLYTSYYMLMVSCIENEDTGIVTLRAFLDSNPLFIADDANFTKGTLALYAPTGSELWCSETEMFQMPLESDRINPNPLL